MSASQTEATTEEPLGRVDSFVDQVHALRYQVSKYGYLRGPPRYARLQATRWSDVYEAARRQGREEYLARSASNDGGWWFFPGVGAFYRPGTITGSRRLWVLLKFLGFYARLGFRLLLLYLLVPAVVVLGLLSLLMGVLELDPAGAVGGAVLFVVSAGFVYWLGSADVDDRPSPSENDERNRGENTA